MASPQDQYAEPLKAGQEAVAQAVDAWTKSAQRAFGTQPVGTSGHFDPNQVIDQVFDFAEKMLQVQREYAKTLTSTAASAAEAARTSVETAGEQTGRTDEAPSAQTKSREG
jgi:hypothetical protein